MQTPAAIQHWFPSGAAITRPIATGRGFSGARHWQVEHEGRRFILRQWPMGGVDAERLAAIHNFQQLLASHDLPVPALQPTGDGATFVNAERQFWELTTWMPGHADYWSDPRPEKLAAALKTLAQIHIVSALTPGSAEHPSQMYHTAGQSGALQARILGTAPAARRASMLNQLISERDLTVVRAAIAQLPKAERQQAQHTLVLVLRLAPRELVKSRRWQDVTLPVAKCLRDIWHDHVLFTGDRVTGIIDFGAAALWTPAVDIARLLGSLVADDHPRSAAGLAAYESIRPLTDDERDAVSFFDSTGVVLSAANWLQWLYGAPAARLAGTFDRAAALSRFNTLAARLQTLAAAAGA